MPIRIAPVDQIAAKYVERAMSASKDYLDGVKNPARDQAEAAIAASASYAQGVTAAIADDRFSKGLRAAGSEKWSRNATTKGARNYGPGVSAARGDYSTAIAPFLQTLSNLTLPPRAPRGDPSNNSRVLAVNQALRAEALRG